MVEGKKVGTQSIEVDVFEYEGVNIIENIPPQYSDLSREETWDWCRWGKQNNIKDVESYERIGQHVGICDVDLSDVDDARYYGGNIHFKNKKTIRVYVENRESIGLMDIVHIKVVGGK